MANTYGVFKGKGKHVVLNAKRSVEQLKAAWGENFNEKLQIANFIYMEHVPEKVRAYLKHSKMDRDVEFIKYLASLGEKSASMLDGLEEGGSMFNTQLNKSRDLVTEGITRALGDLRSRAVQEFGPLPADFDKQELSHFRVIEEDDDSPGPYKYENPTSKEGLDAADKRRAKAQRDDKEHRESIEKPHVEEDDNRPDGSPRHDPETGKPMLKYNA